VLTFATREWFDSWTTPDKPKGFGSGVDQEQQIGEWKTIDRTGDPERWDYAGDAAWMG
jgi:hypothetical protein